VEGDALEIAGLRLTVARMEGPQIVQVGLLLPRGPATEETIKDKMWQLRRKAP